MEETVQVLDEINNSSLLRIEASKEINKAQSDVSIEQIPQITIRDLSRLSTKGRQRTLKD